MSSVVLNPQIAALPVYVPGKPIEEVVREHGLEPGGIIKLASNENPLGPSPKALATMARDSKALRGTGPFVFAQVRHGVGVDDILGQVIHAWQHERGVAHHH